MKDNSESLTLQVALVRAIYTRSLPRVKILSQSDQREKNKQRKHNAVLVITASETKVLGNEGINIFRTKGLVLKV